MYTLVAFKINASRVCFKRAGCMVACWRRVGIFFCFSLAPACEECWYVVCAMNKSAVYTVRSM